MLKNICIYIFKLTLFKKNLKNQKLININFIYSNTKKSVYLRGMHWKIYKN